MYLKVPPIAVEKNFPELYLDKMQKLVILLIIELYLTVFAIYSFFAQRLAVAVNWSFRNRPEGAFSISWIFS